MATTEISVRVIYKWIPEKPYGAKCLRCGHVPYRWQYRLVVWVEGEPQQIEPSPDDSVYCMRCFDQH